MPRWVMVALMLVAAGAAGRRELVLVEQGQARAQVVVPAEAPSAVAPPRRSSCACCSR